MASLLTLADQVKLLESLPDCLVMTGQLISGRPTNSIRRTLKPREDEEPNLENSSRQWCLIEIDELALPEHLSDYQNNKTEIIDFSASHLPPQFHNVQC